jgi:hypothetical protein
MKYLGMFVVVVWLLAACNYQPVATPDSGELEAQAGFVDLGGALDITLTNQAQTSSLVLDKTGKPVVAWQEDAIIHLKTWNGSSWVQRALPLGSNFSLVSLSPESLAIDNSNNPVLAYMSEFTEFKAPNANRWDGTKWVNLPFGAVSGEGGNNTITMATALDKTNRPLVAFSSNLRGEAGSTETSQGLWVTRWDGTKLAQLGQQVEGYFESFSTGVKRGTPFDVGSLSLATDNLDRPVVAVSRCPVTTTPCNNNLYVKRWDGSKWVQLGTSLSRSASNSTYKPSLAVAKDGTLFVAYIENVSGDINLYVKKWTGSTWVQVSSNVDSAGSGVDNPSLALTPDGRPMVAYDESYNGNRNIYIKVLSLGGTWGYVGARVERTITNNAYLPSLAVDAAGNAIFSYEEEVAGQQRNVYVRRFQPDVSKTWTPLGNQPVAENAGFFSIDLDGSGQPVVAFGKGTGLNFGEIYRLYAQRWTGSSWVQVGGAITGLDYAPASFSFASNGTNSFAVAWQGVNPSITEYNIYVKRWNGSAWVQLGDFLDTNKANNAFEPSIDVDPSGNPSVAWIEQIGGASSVVVKRWDGSKWVQLGNVGVSSAETVKLRVDATGKPTIAWTESTPTTSSDLYVKRWNGSRWLQLGSALDTDINNNVLRGSIAIDSAGNPIVAFGEITPGVGNDSTYAKKWNGSQWVQLGSSIGNLYSDFPNISIDGSGNLLVAFRQQITSGPYAGNYDIIVKRWNGNSWGQLGNPLTVSINSLACCASIRANSSGEIFAGWTETDNSSNPSYVKRYK